MSAESERPVELGKRGAREPARPAAAPTQKLWADDVPPRELPGVPTASGTGEPWSGQRPPSVPGSIAPVPPAGPVRADGGWAGGEQGAPVELPPYPPPPPPVYPVPGPMAYGVPQYPGPVPYQPMQAGPVPRYGYTDDTPIWSILSFCCVAASVLGGAMLCGLPVLITAPTGIVLGVVGHGKGEQMGKWAAIANGVTAALAALAVVLFIAFLGSI
ncbi:hypothetical protein [Nocardia rhizosphaerae]|uniref:DUF4190 domain-containing protein n=1 Tax=Nocardia rhizosphaerae TaxID=1691571 RepID=A0ABV8L4C7_9NOCA